MDVPAIQAALLDWYDVHRRDLPWRAKPGEAIDPYRVWVSEAMLQQTRADVVAPRFEDWMQRFPTIDALAKGAEDAVLAAWSGLGFYGRARRLHAAAKVVAAVHGGRLPQFADDLQCLPGIGPYIAGAVASIAFGEAVPAVDGNVVRVVSRLGDVAEAADKGPGKRAINRIAARLVPGDRPGDWNQALMDLGSAICTPKPSCNECPLAPHCAAHASGTTSHRPVVAPKRPPVEQRLHFAIIWRGDAVLMVKRDDGLLAGTWLPPGGGRGDDLVDLVRSQTGLEVRVDEAVGRVKHVFSHRVWDAVVHPAHVIEGDVVGAQWVRPDDVGTSTAARKLLAQVEHAVP